MSEKDYYKAYKKYKIKLKRLQRGGAVETVTVNFMDGTNQVVQVNGQGNSGPTIRDLIAILRQNRGAGYSVAFFQGANPSELAPDTPLTVHTRQLFAIPQANTIVQVNQMGDILDPGGNIVPNLRVVASDGIAATVGDLKDQFAPGVDRDKIAVHQEGQEGPLADNTHLQDLAVYYFLQGQ